jgi:hypothetical protein
MEERIIKKLINKIIYLIATISIASCKEEPLVYSIEENYSGVCAVFIINKNGRDEKYIYITKSLSIIAKSNLSKKFIFEDRQTKSEIDIIEIGKTALDAKRYIYRLFKTTTSNECGEDIELISFYVGTQREFDAWKIKKIDELQTLELSGIDWCNYYKTRFKE